MKYADREEFKKAANGLIDCAQTPEARVEGYVMLIEAHFHRNPEAPDFPTYASHWIAASEAEIVADTLDLLLLRFPRPSVRMIETGYSNWNSFGDPTYRKVACDGPTGGPLDIPLF
jgi:hypothetical protein